MGHTIGRKNWMCFLLAFFAFLSVSMGFAGIGEAQQNPAGMIANWKFDECAGATAADAVNGNTGTLVNGPVWTPRQAGCALSFNGVNTSVAVVPSSTLNVANQLTIEAWINMAAPAGGPQHYIVDSRDGSLTGGYGLNVDTELIQFWIGQQWPNFPVSISAGAWHHIAGTYDGATMVVYVDGTVVGSAPFSASSSPSTAPLFIGQRYTFNEIFNGLIDDVAIYNRALSQTEVQQRYQSGLNRSPLLNNPVNDHWYQRFDTSMSWHQAKAFCDAKGGYLATITSQSENDFVYGNLAALSAPQWSWLGATDEATEGAWKWVTPEPFSYTNWAGGEPNNCNTENHLMYFTPPDGRAGAWNDLNTGNSGSGVPGGCGCGGCLYEWYAMSTICEWGGFCTKAPAGIINWWTGDHTATDSVGGHHGTLAGGATYAPGKVGPAFSFGSAGAMVTVPDDPALNIESLAASSFEGWFKSNGGSDYGDAVIIAKHTCGVATGWFFTTDQGCFIGDDYVGGYGVSGLNLDDGQFHHFACVKDGAIYREYIDGVLTGESTGPSTGTPANESVVIGSIISGGSICVGSTHQLYGVADELALYSRALSADEVRAIYLTGAAGKCKQVSCGQPLFTYTGDVLPSADGWTIVNYPAYESTGAHIENGVLHFTDPYTWGGSAIHYKRAWDVAPGYLNVAEFDIKGKSCGGEGPYGGFACIYFGSSDGTHNMIYTVYPDRLLSSYMDNGVYSLPGTLGETYYFDTTQAFNAYRAVIQNDRALLYINGRLVMDQPAGRGIYGVNGIEFGAGSSPAYGEGYFDEVRAIRVPIGGCNQAPIANAGPDQAVEMTSCAGASVTLNGSASSDPDNDPLTYTWTENGATIATGVDPAVTLAYGTHTITLTIDDGKGGTATDDVVINVVDTTPPVLTVSASPNTLWPPDHKYVTVTPTTAVTDACVATTTVKLLSVASNEPDNGLGDGDTTNDIVINKNGTISLRAERSGTGSGRVYTITYQATDAAGNTSTATATVKVPHNR